MSRQRLNLNRDWKFFRGDVDGAERPDFDDSQWESIGLPHSFDLPYFRTPENEWGEHSAICDTPAELLVIDLFIHESFAFAIPPEAALYSEMRKAVRFPGPERERNRLPLNETLQDLGTGPLVLATPEVPKHKQMIGAMFDRAGWDARQFHGFRMKISYPACPTALVLRYRLPEEKKG